MKISVVTVVRNNVSGIDETIRSVLEQDWDDVEYIVIDGASNDGTVDRVAAYGAKIGCFVSEPDHGIYEAMNKGIARATGEVIGILNSGDRYYPGALRRVAEAFQTADMERTILWGDVEYEHQGRVRGFRPENRWRGAFAPHPSMFVPRAVYRRIGVYDETLRLLGDYDFMYRAVNVEKITPLYLPEVLAFYREGGLSDRHRFRCLRDELQVKLRYGQPLWKAGTVFLLKIVKNLPRMALAKE